MNTGRGKIPVSAATGQGYGQAKAQMDAQRAVPMGGSEVAPPTAWNPQQGRPAGLPAPGSIGDLTADSTDPTEHVMSGAPLGPGPGPEAFGGGDDEHAQDLAHMAPYLPALRSMARSPNASPALVLFVRRLSAGL